MSDSSRVQLYKLEEVTLGTTPASAMTEVRMTGESLNFSITNTQSAEIRADRQITDLVQTSAESGGDVNVEMSHTAHDDFLESAFFSSFPSELTITASTIDASNADNSFNDSGAGFPAFVAGQWIKVSGFTEAANNGYFQVVSRTTSKIVVSGGTLTTEAAGDSVTIRGTMMRNGTTRKSFTLEKLFSDKTEYISYTGMVVGNASFNVSVDSILTATFSFLGLSSAAAGTTVGTGGPTAAPSGTVLNAVSNVAQIREGGTVSTLFFQDLSFTINNNLRALRAVGSLPHIDIGSGQCVVEAQMRAYFENRTLYEKYVNGTESSLSFKVEDASGNAYIFTFPRTKFQTGQVVTPGANQDIIADFTLQAIRDASTNCTIQVDQFLAP